jgi:formate hydrogenlyase transcriptional activator
MSSADPNARILNHFGYLLRSWYGRYAFAVLAVVIATVTEFSLQSTGLFHGAFKLFYPVVVLVALYAGVGPGVLATALAAISAGYFFVEPKNSFAIRTPEHIVAPAIFTIIGLFLTFLTASRRAKITERKLSQVRMQEYESALQGFNEMIVLVDRNYRYVLANGAFLQGRGLVKEQVVGHPLVELMGSETFETVVKPKLDECFQGAAVHFEKRFDYPTLGMREFSVSYLPLARPNGIENVAVIMHDITEKKQAEHSLQLFRALMDESNDAVEVVDPETLRFLDVNETACRELGHTREEMLSMTVFDICPEADDAYRLKVLARVRESGHAIFQVSHRRKDGSMFPVEVSLRCVRLDKNYIIAVCRDISERKRAEGALRESEDRYRDLEQQSEDLLCTHDLQGNLLSVNPAPARILGYSTEELLKIPMRELIVPEGRVLFDAYLERLKTTGQPESGLLCVMKRDGEIRTWEFYNTLRTDGVETPIVRGMAHDITEQRRAELALRSSEDRYRILFEKAVAGVGIIGLEGRVIDCNDAWAHMFGYSNAAECRNCQIGERYPDPSDRHAFLRELKRSGACLNRELEMRRLDGSPLWILLNTVMLTDGLNQPLIQSTIFDITARKQAEDALLRNEERFQVALKDSPVTVFNQDRALRYVWIYNPPPEWPLDVIGKTCNEVVGAKNAARINELNQRVLETGKGIRAELTFGHNGQPKAFDVILEPLLDSAGAVVGITGSLTDIARLRELADQLKDQRDKLVREKSYLEEEIEAELGFEEIIGQSPVLLDVLKKARVVAPTDSTVLLLGETGTGKELVARALHSLSHRHEKSFIKLNCAAVPSGLLESDLFGHEKGAFTSAVSQKMGRLELADGGTLFLDEVGELPLELQPKLLRVLQDREFERLGGVRTLRVDVRIISATNRDLRKDIAEKRFREDLFYRLNVFPIELPALRERKSDIPMLVHHFVRKFAARMGRRIEIVPRETMNVLENWHWPGNIRELENMIERMVILSNGEVLAPPPVELEGDFAGNKLEEMEREHIIRVLRETHGVLSGPEGAASRLGMKRTTLQSMLKRFGIQPDEYRRVTGIVGTE